MQEESWKISFFPPGAMTPVYLICYFLYTGQRVFQRKLMHKEQQVPQPWTPHLPKSPPQAHFLALALPC